MITSMCHVSVAPMERGWGVGMSIKIHTPTHTHIHTRTHPHTYKRTHTQTSIAHCSQVLIRSAKSRNISILFNKLNIYLNNCSTLKKMNYTKTSLSKSFLSILLVYPWLGIYDCFPTTALNDDEHIILPSVGLA